MNHGKSISFALIGFALITSSKALGSYCLGSRGLVAGGGMAALLGRGPPAVSEFRWPPPNVALQRVPFQTVHACLRRSGSRAGLLLAGSHAQP